MSNEEGYQTVLALADLADGAMKRVEPDDGPGLVVFRLGDEVFALDDACPHAGAPLSEGFVTGENVTCSWHGWTFNIRDGESAEGAGCQVQRHECRVENGQVLVKRTGA